MPFPVLDRPTPPEQPSAQPSQEVDVNGKKVPVSVVKEFLSWGAKHGYVIMIPQGQGAMTQMMQSFGEVVTSLDAGDRVGAARAFRKVSSGLLEVGRVHKVPDADLNGVPPRAGVAQAMRTASGLLMDDNEVRSLYRIDPAWLGAQANECEFLCVLEETYQEGEAHVASVLAPLTKRMVTEVRPAANMLRPKVAASLQLTQQAAPLYTYLDAPHVKAVESRRGNARREEAADQRAEERLGAAARTEAREEVKGNFLDAVTAALTVKK